MNRSLTFIPTDGQAGVPCVDLYAHLEGIITAARAVEIAQARGAGIHFSFGSNQHGPEVARIDYCLHAAQICSLGPEHIFLPGKEKNG